MLFVTYTIGTTHADLEPNGLYYYSVIALNSSGESACSNCQNVTVAIINPTPPILSSINPNHSNDPHISLFWSAGGNAAGYRVYRSTTFIDNTTIGSLSPIATVSRDFYFSRDLPARNEGTNIYQLKLMMRLSSALQILFNSE